MRRTRDHFAQIDSDVRLSAKDKDRLKEYYLEHFVTPKAKALMGEISENGADADQRTGAASSSN
jgi:hypothetical protein